MSAMQVIELLARESWRVDRDKSRPVRQQLEAGRVAVQLAVARASFAEALAEIVEENEPAETTSG
jgi:hypothetical protein